VKNIVGRIELRRRDATGISAAELFISSYPLKWRRGLSEIGRISEAPGENLGGGNRIETLKEFNDPIPSPQTEKHRRSRRIIRLCSSSQKGDLGKVLRKGKEEVVD